jgi:SAM-dependent methyltransferase
MLHCATPAAISLIVKETLARSLHWLDGRFAPLARHLPETLKAPLRRLARGAPVETPPHEHDAQHVADLIAEDVSPPVVEAAPPESIAEPAPVDEYAERLRREQEIFADQIDINELPRIYHYWSHTYLRPKLEAFGVANPDEFFADALLTAARESGASPARFVSLGAGNCDTEVRVAQILLARGFSDFTLECVDINPIMLERGATLARETGLAAQVLPITGDFNDWQPARRYDAVMANQSLHHVMNLEGLFDAIAANLPPHGRFVISDMIGRNGHLRWPEALSIVREFWAELPPHYRFHRQLREQWDEFVDFDCSGEGFEGIRAQDILPLLIERFGFERFLGFANVIDAFIDRGFGGHFDADSPTDRDLIDRIHARDEAGMLDGSLKPTHAMAVMRNASYAGATQVWSRLTPQHSLRIPD